MERLQTTENDQARNKSCKINLQDKSNLKKKKRLKFQNTVIILHKVCSVRKLAVNMKQLLIYLYCIKGQRLNSVLEKANLQVLLFKKTKEFEFYDNLFKC